ncbi:MAG TPA: AAA family ATPase [Pirellulales bacterium]
MATDTLERAESLLAALKLDEGFRPQELRSEQESGLSAALIEDLILKYLAGVGSASGRAVADHLCLPMVVLENRYTALRSRQEISPVSSGMLGDYIYRLTDQGREKAQRAIRECAYAGPAPVPLEDYANSVQAQNIRSEKPRQKQLEAAFADIVVSKDLLQQLGPAINAGKGMFIYGPPGNGKTTIAQRITRCFGQSIFVPHAIVEDGQIIKLYDGACHQQVRSGTQSIIREAEFDRRWVRIHRPTVVIGGELTMDNLELKHNAVSNVNEASLQLKSNCGCLLIDDFGRQRVDPVELLNRWIVPLENHVDYLTLGNGKKIEVPFEQLIIFSTNLEPHKLADEAFLRRIPFKIEVGAPDSQEFHTLFRMFAEKHHIDCPDEMVDYLIRKHYTGCDRPLRRCHARDLLEQIQYYCEYNEYPPTVNDQHLDYAVRNYFTSLPDEPSDRAVPVAAHDRAIPVQAYESHADQKQTLVRVR